MKFGRLQGHWAVGEPVKDQLDQTLKDFSAHGLPLYGLFFYIMN